jgi:hypothetical protein
MSFLVILNLLSLHKSLIYPAYIFRGYLQIDHRLKFTKTVSKRVL